MDCTSNDPIQILNLFESLGDNCEFGFVQRKSGIEGGGLLRWAISQPTPLIGALSSRFANLYKFEHLEPSADSMVLDNTYGLFFHSNMKSRIVDGVRTFIDLPNIRRDTYETELVKLKYLVAKLMSQLESAEKIFVYKQNVGVHEKIIDQLYEEIRTYNQTNSLLVVEVNKNSPGIVRQVRPGLIKASIDRLAPYDQADDISYEAWIEICQKAVEILC